MPRIAKYKQYKSEEIIKQTRDIQLAVHGFDVVLFRINLNSDNDLENAKGPAGGP